MKLCYDIEATNLIDHTSIDYSSYPFRLKKVFKVHCIVFKDIETGKKWRLYEESLTKENIEKLLDKTSELIAHNQINYDLSVLFLNFGIDYYIGSGKDDPSTINGKEVKITDTLVKSRVLYPDRFGGHSLKAWGIRLGFYKGDYGQQENAWDKFSEEMLDYCEQDVDLCEQVYYALEKEEGDWPWQNALEMEHAIADVIFRQEHFGFKFNKELAEECLEDLNLKMEEIEKKVEPLLPKKPISKTNAKKFIPPKIQLRKDLTLTTHMENFIKRHNGSWKKDEYGDYCVTLFGKEHTLPMEQKPLVKEEPMLLANQSDLKQFLVREGWNPTVWADKDITIDNNKRKLSDEKYQASVYRYCEETQTSDFKKYRLQHMKVKSVKDLYKLLMTRDRKRPIKVITSPKYTVNPEKDLCPNLEKLGERVAFVKDVVYWLTYRHRRNSILSPKGTGFLAQPRIEIDGRIQTPAISCGASTSRMQHKVCANIPRATSLYGEPMRRLFEVEKGTFQIGCDAAGLEARVEGHYTKPFDYEGDYVKALLSEKPNDIHTVTGKKMNVSRDDAKTLKYASSYGAQPPKIAKQMDWSLSKAQKVFDDFWDAAAPLAELKKRVSAYWRGKGQKTFIKGIDGRKLYARSEHSLVNLLFQSCGVIIMKKAAVMVDRWMQQEGILFNPFKDSTFEGKAAEMIHYHKLIVASH